MSCGVQCVPPCTPLKSTSSHHTTPHLKVSQRLHAPRYYKVADVTSYLKKPQFSSKLPSPTNPWGGISFLTFSGYFESCSIAFFTPNMQYASSGDAIKAIGALYIPYRYITNVLSSNYHVKMGFEIKVRVCERLIQTLLGR